jgi:hypothetical protein
MEMIWFMAGVAAGWMMFLTQKWTVDLVSPRKLAWMVRWGAVVRWIFAAGVMAAGVITDWKAGLAAFLGLQIARWAGLLYISSCPNRNLPCELWFRRR